MVVDMADIGRYYVTNYGISLRDPPAEGSSPTSSAVKQLLESKDTDMLDRAIVCAMLKELQGLCSDMKKMRTDFEEERVLLRQLLIEDKKIAADATDGLTIVRDKR